MRYAKREAAMLDAAGDREGFEAAALKVQAWQEKLRAFVGEHESLRLEGDRVQVHGYGRKQAARVRSAVAAAERTEKASLDFTAGSGTIKMPKDPRFAELSTDIEERSRQIHEILNDYTDRKSKWSGKTVVATEAEMLYAIGKKTWECDIILREGSGIKTAIHEHLHARSFSWFPPETLQIHRNLEEGAVEMFAQEICRINKIPCYRSYKDKVNPLRKICGCLSKNQYSFAKELFEVNMPNRYGWLRKQIADAFGNGQISAETKKILLESLQVYIYRGGK